jgi:hypothetical protein
LGSSLLNSLRIELSSTQSGRGFRPALGNATL